MRKQLFFLTTILTTLTVALTINNRIAAFAEGEAGYIEKSDSKMAEDCFEIVTNSPWVSGTKWEISFSSQAINKAYLVFDFDVTLSKNNPELVSRLGLNGNYFTGHDGENFHGSSGSIMKNYGDWFFLTPGRNQLYLPTNIFCTSITSMDKFGLYFDTGFANRSGSSLNIYGLYLADTFDEELMTNYITPKNYQEHEDLITKVGVTSNISVDKVVGSIKGAFLYGDYINSLLMHVKFSSEGGKTTEQPDDYGYITVDLGRTVDISSDEGFAFSTYALEGETYFRIVLEDNNHHFYMPAFNGGAKEDAGSYPMINDSILMGILHFYGALFLEEKQSGTVYIPYDKFVGIDYMFGQTQTISSERIANISKIHIGMDMKYGLGRNLVINEFATCNNASNSITSLIRLADLSETEWNRDNYSQSTKISCNNSSKHQGNFVLSALPENRVPGTKDPISIDELNNVIALARTLNEKDYTSVSWATLKTKLENAENIAQYSELYEQTDINEAVKGLLKAIRGLKSAEKDGGDGDKSKQGCQGSIVSTSIIIFSLTITSLLLLAIKRKEKYNHEK